MASNVATMNNEWRRNGRDFEGSGRG